MEQMLIRGAGVDTHITRFGLLLDSVLLVEGSRPRVCPRSPFPSFARSLIKTP